MMSCKILTEFKIGHALQLNILVRDKKFPQTSQNGRNPTAISPITPAINAGKKMFSNLFCLVENPEG